MTMPDVIKETEVMLYKANLYSKQYVLWAGALVAVTQRLVAEAKKMKEQLGKVETACQEECLYRDTDDADDACDCPACLVWVKVNKDNA